MLYTKSVWIFNPVYTTVLLNLPFSLRRISLLLTITFCQQDNILFSHYISVTVFTVTFQLTTAHQGNIFSSIMIYGCWRFEMVITRIIFLSITIMVSINSAANDKILSRKKRYLVFPEGSSLSVSIYGFKSENSRGQIQTRFCMLFLGVIIQWCTNLF